MDYTPFLVNPGQSIRLKDYDPVYTGHYRDKAVAQAKLAEGIRQLSDFQDVLYAQNTYALLILFQAMDAAAKDSTIKHVMSGINPQGCQVFSFQAPSAEELDHDYLWRSMKTLPERGRIGIHNRSYYEEVLIVRVHPELLSRQQLPAGSRDQQIWHRRFEQINAFEKYLVENGIVILKFFLNVSKAEQRKRFLDRIGQPEKHWKFALADVMERQYWDQYMFTYEQVFSHTSTPWAPWHVIPADHKWFTRLSVAEMICDRLRQLDLRYPTVSEERQQLLLQAKIMLENEAQQ
jgi:PPK2 family polyphosphate:nucleotide phosphotransferase